MGELEIALLGKPEIRHEGKLVSFATRKALALLIYLAVEGGAVSREKLSTLFWPDSSSEQGRTTLRTTLVFVREALEETRETTQPHLRANHETVQLNPDFALDLHHFQKAVRLQSQGYLVSVPSAAPPQDISPLIANLEKATSLYRSDFLDGFSLSDAPEFDDWSSFLRESLHRQATLAFDWLSQLQFESGQLNKALTTAQRWIALDSLNEVAYQRVMQLYLALGERAAALKIYEQCARLLAQELGLEPTPETHNLAERIRRSTPQRLEADVSTKTLAQGSDLLTPLVGRVAEYSQLVRAYRWSRRYQLQVIAVEGEPGIGKTRLVNEFIVWAGAQGAEIFQARAFETGTQIAYQPITEMLREWLAHESHPDQMLPLVWLSELGRLLPVLHERIPGLTPQLLMNPTEAQARLFEAVSRWGQALAEQTALVLFMDDLQWIDASSLDLLLYVSRHWKQAPILIVYAVRSEDLRTPLMNGLPSSPTLERWFGMLQKEVALTRLALGELTLEDTRELLHDLLGDTSAEQMDKLSQQLFRDTSGQPFFLVQTLKALLERNSIQPDQVWEDVEGTIQPDVQNLIQSRLARLDTSALSLCNAAAVLGEGFRFEPLCRVSSLDEQAGLTALESLVLRGILREAGGRYFFTHDKIREVVYAQIGEARRRVLHRRALDILANAATPPVELLRHALASEQFRRAFDLSVATGDESLRLFAVRDAIVHFERALTLLTQQDAWQAEIAVEAQFHLYLQLGDAYELVSEWSTAEGHYQSALSLAHSTGQIQAECTVLNRLATLAAQFTYDPVAALGYLQQARSLAQASQDLPGLAQTEWNLAQTGFFYWNLPEALSHGQRALALGRQLNQPNLIAGGLSVIGYVGLVTGMPLDELIDLCEEARQLYAAIGNRVMEADCLWVMASAYVHTGRPQDAISAGRKGLAVSQQIENDWAYTNNAYNLGLGLLEIGEYADALQVVQQGLAKARGGHPPTLIFHLIVLGAIYRALQAPQTALELHQEAWQIAQRIPQPFVAEWVAAEVCADCAQLEQWDTAHEFAVQALMRRTYQWAYPGFTRWNEVEALLRAGDTQQAIDDLRKFGEQLKDFGETRRYDVMRLRSQAALAQSQADVTTAIEFLQAAIAQAEQIGLAGELWQLYAALAGLYQNRGRGEDAQQAARQARAIGDALAPKITDERLRSAFLDSVYRKTADG